MEFIQWQGHNKRTGPGHEEDVRAEAVRETTKRWPNVEKLSAKAHEAYDELVKVMRATAIFEPVVAESPRRTGNSPGSSEGHARSLGEAGQAGVAPAVQRREHAHQLL